MERSGRLNLAGACADLDETVCVRTSLRFGWNVGLMRSYARSVAGPLTGEMARRISRTREIVGER
jgi:hypothetical protein